MATSELHKAKLTRDTKCARNKKVNMNGDFHRLADIEVTEIEKGGGGWPWLYLHCNDPYILYHFSVVETKENDHSKHLQRILSV